MNWQEFLEQQKQQDYFQQLMSRVANERDSEHAIYPPENQVFSAFDLTPFEQVKVVILGQDPYHGPGQAHGLAFSVQDSVKVPPSLKNMYKELLTDINGFDIPEHGNLTCWAEQGVLLLNTVLTVRQGQAHSHAKFGWETFTDAVIAALNEHADNLVFILWGKHAQQKGKYLDDTRHCILSGAHPSPLSAYRGFFGCQHFSLANQYLQQQGKQAIDWRVPEMVKKQGQLF
ncbi:uracil-DNA glycosylase [Thalassotalea sp. HSM 43]|uniref:uracil-DNA glycosylase n=1 Tax=Thalassotalea sp. HSM 43 TaxID=2552945 RepID=UPI001081A74C|nr:uracil-DNA glycosylase [Thalassotalea sp. HSM 43]QBY03789.1 uracil-DNA glycosylase [Thalassotalea sp. HSM 43]